MVLYKWKKLNPNIAVRPVKKKLFNQYYYSIKYYCPGGRIILQPNMNTFENIDNEASARLNRNKFYLNSMNYGYYPISHNIHNQLEENRINSHQLLAMMSAKKRNNDNIKIRIVDPYITFYADNENILLKIAEYDLYAWSSFLEEVSGPESDSLIDLLDKNVIFVKKDIGYRYKFMCKEGRYQNKESIYSYLDQLDDQVKVSNTVWTSLESTKLYLRNIWFYSNNKELAHVLNIIEPNVVTNIHELVIV
jgi:hypothetical protein